MYSISESGVVFVANEHNLMQNQNTTPQQRRINAQKAGIASAAAKKERKKLREELLLLLETGDTQQKMCTALIEKAQSGDVKAFEMVRDTVGEKPTDTMIWHYDEQEDDPLTISLKELAGELDGN